jgi:hypothetical protein
MWELYAQRTRGGKCEMSYEFGNNLMKIMCLEEKKCESWP